MENLDKEKQQVIDAVSKYIDLTVVPCAKEKRTVIDVEERAPMYSGDGVVYMLSLFEKGELVNNRIGVYMVLLNNGDQAGFHEHGSKNEQELYVIVSGEARYEEKLGADGAIRTLNVKKGNVISIQDDYYHQLTNTGTEPLIVFVVTTYKP